MSSKPISITEKTILNEYNLIQNSFDLTPKYHLTNTLNFKYSLWPTQAPIQSPKLRYFGIGLGGRYNVNSKTLMGPIPPNTEDMDLFDPIPFRCRPLDEDLNDSERSLYRIRYVQEIHGVAHACYYLKKIRIEDSEVQIYRVNPATGSLEPYELENSNLYPVPVIPDTSGTQESTGPDIVVGLNIALPITATEVFEYIDIKFDGDRRYAVLSEYGIYSGEDAIVTTPGYQGATISYTESMCTTLEYKTCTAGTLVENEAWNMSREVLVGSSVCMLQ